MGLGVFGRLDLTIGPGVSGANELPAFTPVVTRDHGHYAINPYLLLTR